MPLITPLEDVLAVAPQAAAQPASAEREQPGTLDTLAAAFRQNSSVSTLYERFANEQSLPFQKNFAIPRAEGYDPYEEVTDFADDPDALRVLMRAESPEELQFLKDRVRRERSDRQTIAEAGGWGLASSLAAGITDPILLASMAIPLAPALTGVGRVGRVAAGVAATAAVDSAAEAVLHSGQELRTVGESAFNVGAGVLLSSVLGGIVTRIPKGELDVVRRELQAEIARANGVEMPAVNQAGEGADSFGAARAVGTSREDEGIARGGQTIAKTLGRISPLTRTLQSPFKSARVLAQKLVDVPYMLTKNLRGKATPASVERAVKRLVNLGRYHVRAARSPASSSARKSRPRLRARMSPRSRRSRRRSPGRGRLSTTTRRCSRISVSSSATRSWVRRRTSRASTSSSGSSTTGPTSIAASPTGSSRTRR
jgi:hypothetical protein